MSTPAQAKPIRVRIRGLLIEKPCVRAGDRLIGVIGLPCLPSAGSGEGILKTFLAWHDRPFRKTHNLLELGKECVQSDSSLESLLREATLLTEFAWKYRYSGAPDPPPLSEADDALALARDAFNARPSRLPKEAEP